VLVGCLESKYFVKFGDGGITRSAYAIYNAEMTALYAAFLPKLLSKSKGVVFERHESESRTPQEVMATHFGTARQALTTVE